MFNNLEVRAYVVNLNDYNNGVVTGGVVTGGWVDLPQEEEKISELIYNLTDEGKYDYEILDIECSQEVRVDLYDEYQYDLADLNRFVNKLMELEEWELLEFGRNLDTYFYNMSELGEYLQGRFEKDPEGAFSLGRNSTIKFSYSDPYFKEDGYRNLVSLTESEFQEDFNMLLEEYIKEGYLD